MNDYKDFEEELNDRLMKLSSAKLDAIASELWRCKFPDHFNRMNKIGFIVERLRTAASVHCAVLIDYAINQKSRQVQLSNLFPWP
jgi:hypothetical protein